MVLRRTNVNCSIEVADDNCCDCVAVRQVVHYCCQVFDADDDDNDSDFAGFQAYSKKKEEKNTQFN